MKESKIIIKVFGYVQGVFFRYTTRKVARNLGLTGYVKNMPDGTVYIEAEGPNDKLLELLEFSKKGPRHAHVERVEHKFTQPTNEFEGFDYAF
ncbi:MAG: acylphosphatase [Promethearchaeota archaeon]|nr:MAG: acylphosphatase [Candidatus Lokiarchaeota archaeon]